MTKEQLVKRIAKEARVSLKAAGKAVDVFAAAVTAELKRGGRVCLVGFGTFAARKVKARKGRNPRTGKEIRIPACVRPVFRAGKGLKDAVNK